MNNIYKVKLLKKVLRELKTEKNVKFYGGLCIFSYILRAKGILTTIEGAEFRDLLYKNKPKQIGIYGLFFPAGKKEPRIKFLKDLIEKYQPKSKRSKK